MAAFLNYFGIGGFAFVLLTVFVEITPIKLNPIQWIGSRFNSGIRNDIDKMQKKLDEHIVQSYRNIILEFQNELLSGKLHTQEQFNVVLQACDAYEAYIEENNIRNGVITQAIEYIRQTHIQCLSARSFINLPGHNV